MVILGCLLVWVFADHDRYCRLLAVATAFSTAGVVLNVVGLVGSLLGRRVNAAYLLLDAALLYASNILLFTVWYWLLDHGSQVSRALHQPTRQVLVFPQNAASYEGHHSWQSGYVDYLLLAFNTSSTFGPTETLPLGRAVRVGIMAQVTISLVVLVVLAARSDRADPIGGSARTPGCPSTNREGVPSPSSACLLTECARIQAEKASGIDAEDVRLLRLRKKRG